LGGLIEASQRPPVVLSKVLFLDSRLIVEWIPNEKRGEKKKGK
jgi:hypothetical protein